MKATEKVINPNTAIAILLLTMALALIIGILGATTGSEYESSCSSHVGEKPVCTTRYAYKGLGNLDIPMPSLQMIAAAIGTGFGIYAAVKSGKIPQSFKEAIKQ